MQSPGFLACPHQLSITQAEDCCTANPSIACASAACASCVCLYDPYCCTTQWDAVCVQEASDYYVECAASCGCVVGTATPAQRPTATPTQTDTPLPTFTPTDTPSPTVTPSPTSTPAVIDSCPLFDLGQALPVSATGSTASVSNGMGGASCGDGGADAADVTYEWTAPAGGAYLISTLGSAFNTILSVRDGGCSGTELACNDDSNDTAQSQVIVTLALNQTVIIVLDGSGGDAGDYQLSITQAEDCCTANASAACADATCAACVCGLDPYCCTTQWDALCAGETLDPCGSACSCPTPIPTATVTPTPTPTPPPTPTEPPAGLVIQTPADGSFLNSTPIQVSGQAPGADTVTVTNSRTSESVTVGADAAGAFTAALTAQPGDTLSIFATDRAGNAGPAVTLQVSSSLSVSITSPTTGATVPSDRVTVRGTFRVWVSLGT